MDPLQVGCVAVHQLTLLSSLALRKKRKKPRWWVHPIGANRLTLGAFHISFGEHRSYPEKFFQFYRMSVASFDELLGLTAPFIAKSDTVMRRSIEPAERLGVTLRYLATGMNFGDLEFDFKISRKTVRKIVRQTCLVIWNIIQPQEMPFPTKEQWLKISNDFEQIAQFPNCVGSIDGKHIRIMCPPNSGSEYFNYKKYFSIVLLAVADANYFFTAVDIGSFGREGDSTIFKKSNFGQRLKANGLDLPADNPLQVPDNFEEGPVVPYVFLGDEAFGLSKHVMRPYPSKGLSQEKRIYNYRHCRARRVVECAFGILANKWRVLHSCILTNPDFAIIIVQACCVLHNYVRRRDGYLFEDTLTCPLQEMQEPAVVGGLSKGIDVREVFCDYFNGPGALSWQNRYV